MKQGINPLAFGYAGAAVSAFAMLLLGTLGNLGIYEGAVSMMEQWHMFFSLSVIGIFTGMVEAAVISFVFLYAMAWFYNKFV
ncbi:MAG: hypothetical protein KJ955_02875 [Nanoarchaeota archaeon]|nr:hypothetical protein [Nanoarchaeota archaeon]